MQKFVELVRVGAKEDEGVVVTMPRLGKYDPDCAEANFELIDGILEMLEQGHSLRNYQPLLGCCHCRRRSRHQQIASGYLQISACALGKTGSKNKDSVVGLRDAEFFQVAKGGKERQASRSEGLRASARTLTRTLLGSQ